MNFNLTIDKQLQAVIHRKQCINCGKCEDICPTGAIAEFQKTLSCSEYFTEDKRVSLDFACSAGCPLGIVPQAVSSLVKMGNQEGALELLYSKNPMPWTASQVCEESCMNQCKRGELLDEGLNMGALERYILHDLKSRQYKFIKKYHQRIAIIGGGPAGLGAAFQLSKMGYGVTIFEKDKGLGGAMRWGIPEFRLDRTKMNEEIDSIISAGVEMRTGIEIGKDIFMENIWEEGFAACLIAAGSSHGEMPALPGSEGAMVYDMVTVMRYLNHAMSHDETVPVIGNKVVISGREGLALDAARSMVRRGTEVSLITPYTPEELPISLEDKETALAEGVKLKTGVFLSQIIREGDVVKAVELVTEDGEKTNFFCDTVILVEEQVSRPTDIINAETYPDGKIKINDQYSTNKEMVFACGDITGESDSVVGALDQGMRAAKHMDNVLQGRVLAQRTHRIYSAPPEETLYCSNIPMFYPQKDTRVVGRGLEAKEYAEEVIPMLRTAGIEKKMPSFVGRELERGKKVAVVGGGISGITAAIALAKKGYEPVIFEKTCKLGGRYTWLSTEKRIDKELLAEELAKVEKSGIKVIYNTSAGIFPTFEEMFRKGFDAILLAMGETVGRKPGMPNAQGRNVHDVVSLMSSLAHEEIVDSLGRKVMVTGRDEMSIDMARKLKEHCDNVTLLAPCSKGGLGIMASYVDRLLQEGINIVTGIELMSINEEDGALKSIDCKILEKNLTINIPCDTLVLGGTQVPDTEVMSIRNLEIDMDEEGYPLIDDKLATSVKGVFAIGNFDMSSPDAGKAGAAALDNYLSGVGMHITILPAKEKEMSVTHEIMEGQKAKGKRLEKERVVFSRNQALTEASRCMGCGYHKENINRCIGCGICMKTCPVRAIDMLALKDSQ
ncbi:MAG: FAD-dependent oxidoreductase [Clostridiales bacterium]|nr:FAD-dependent oxidoreductase [Clostridiales bacterium]